MEKRVVVFAVIESIFLRHLYLMGDLSAALDPLAEAVRCGELRVKRSKEKGETRAQERREGDSSGGDVGRTRQIGTRCETERRERKGSCGRKS